MKAIVVVSLFFVLFCLELTNAQTVENEDRVKTLFGNSNQGLGGFGGITARYSQLGSAPGAVVGFRGGLIAGHSMAIGFGGNGLFSTLKYDPKLGKDALFAGGYGGLFIEPIVLPKIPVHVAFPLMMGVGGVSYSVNDNSNDWNRSQDEDNVVDSKAFIVVEPGVEIEFNVVRYFRLALGAYYRYTSDVNLVYQDGTAIAGKSFLNGFSTGVTLKFGKF